MAQHDHMTGCPCGLYRECQPGCELEIGAKLQVRVPEVGWASLTKPSSNLKFGQTWNPAGWSNAAPRQIRLTFKDVTGAPWLQWNYPGYPQRAFTVSERSFRAWIRRHGARPE